METPYNWEISKDGKQVKHSTHKIEAGRMPVDIQKEPPVTLEQGLDLLSKKGIID